MNLFVYGTLLVPEIWKLVARTEFQNTVNAQLPGYYINRVRGADFPGIAKGTDSDRVDGQLIREVSAPALERLDAYEDSFYVRLPVSVSLQNGETEVAQVYVIPENRVSDILSEAPWSIDWFLDNACDQYLARMKGLP